MSSYLEIDIYVVVFMGILFGVMITAIISLAYIIHRLRKSKSDGAIKQYTLPTVKTTEYLRQISFGNSDISSLNQLTLSGPLINKNESTITIFDETDIEMKDMKKEEAHNAAASLIKQETNQQANGNVKKISLQHIIPPDKMKELCTGVLMKMKRDESPSLTHLDRLQNEYKQNDETLARSSTHDDTSFSDMEEYDILPKPVPVNSEDDEEIYNGVYDSPPQKNDWISANGYKMPKPTVLRLSDSFYVNAHEPIL